MRELIVAYLDKLPFETSTPSNQIEGAFVKRETRFELATLSLEG